MLVYTFFICQNVYFTFLDMDWSAAVSAANLLLESSAGADSGCGFSLSNPREGRKLPSERDANGGEK